MTTQQRSICFTKLILMVSSLWLGVLGAGQAVAGGLLLYEVGTPDVGLASAGWGARAQDASTVLTNPAGGRGDVVGSYPETGMFFLAVNFNWVF